MGCKNGKVEKYRILIYETPNVVMILIGIDPISWAKASPT